MTFFDLTKIDKYLPTELDTSNISIAQNPNVIPKTLAQAEEAERLARVTEDSRLKNLVDLAIDSTDLDNPDR